MTGRAGSNPVRPDPVRPDPARPDPASPRDELLSAIPKLRAFATSLCGRGARADDLVQETLVRAWANLGSFQPGSNMVAWLFTILRNEFYSEFRKQRHEVRDQDGEFAARLASHPTQEGHMQFLDFREALGQLVEDHREALILVGGSGLSYEEAASVCGCAVGTMKSRVNRARTRLAELLAVPADNPVERDTSWDASVTTTWTSSASSPAEN